MEDLSSKIQDDDLVINDNQLVETLPNPEGFFNDNNDNVNIEAYLGLIHFIIYEIFRVVQ